MRFIRTGDQIYVTRNIVKIDANGAESGAAFFQAVDPASGTLSVDWKSNPTEQPCLKIGAKSAMGNTVTATDIKWSYRGTELTFNASPETSGTYTGWNISTDGKWAKKWKDGYAYLRTLDNLASTTIISNQIIGYTLAYTTNNISDTVQGTEDVLIQQAGADSYSVTITTDCCTLNQDQTSTILKATCLYGITPITDFSDKKLQWQKDFSDLEGKTGETLTVTRDDVDGSSVFGVKLLIKSGDTYIQKATDSQRVTDDADEWQISAEPDGTNPDAISHTNNAKYKLSLKQNGTTYGGAATWTWTVYNALNVQTGSGTGANVTLTADMAKCTPDSSQAGNTYYSDVAVEVAVEI